MMRGPGGPGGPFGAEIKRAKDRRGTVLRLWTYLRKERSALIFTGILVAIGVLLTVAGPWMTGQAIDVYIKNKDLPGLAMISMLMLGLYFLS